MDIKLSDVIKYCIKSETTNSISTEEVRKPIIQLLKSEQCLEPIELSVNHFGYKSNSCLITYEDSKLILWSYRRSLKKVTHNDLLENGKIIFQVTIYKYENGNCYVKNMDRII